MNSLLLIHYLFWHFWEMPLEILKGWRNILLFNLNYFSVILLLRTFFAPWKGIQWQQGRGFDIGNYLFILSSNLISRIIGAILRTFLIILGLAIEILLIPIGIAVLIIWILLPMFIILGFYFGAKFIF